MSKKMASMFLVALQTCLAIFGRGDVGLLHREDCWFQVSSPATTLDMKVGSSRARWWKSWQIPSERDTNFAMRCMFKSTIAAMSLMDLRRSSCTSRQIVFTGFELVKGHPDLLWSSTDVLPPLKCACHSNTSHDSLLHCHTHVKSLSCTFTQFDAEFDGRSLL